MTSRDFCYWLQGFFELRVEGVGMTSEQVELVKKHLAMVFVHEIDPSFGKDNQKLDQVHGKPDGPVYRC